MANQQDNEGADSEHTLVWNNAGGCVATAMSNGHRALINHHLVKSARSRADVADDLGISRRQLNRILSGKTPLRIEAIVALYDLFGIDRQRALLAIDVLGDWQRYFDTNLGVILQLVQPVLAALDTSAECEIEPLTAPAVARFSEWLAHAIIANEEQIRSRRDSFADLPEVRRPIRRATDHAA